MSLILLHMLTLLRGVAEANFRRKKARGGDAGESFYFGELGKLESATLNRLLAPLSTSPRRLLLVVDINAVAIAPALAEAVSNSSVSCTVSDFVPSTQQVVNTRCQQAVRRAIWIAARLALLLAEPSVDITFIIDGDARAAHCAAPRLLSKSTASEAASRLSCWAACVSPGARLAVLAESAGAFARCTCLIADADADAAARRLALAYDKQTAVATMSTDGDWFCGADVFIDCSRTIKSWGFVVSGSGIVKLSGTDFVYCSIPDDAPRRQS
jgi:hypothetical protein